ncbi:uncharacterized protein AC631_00533 [Debaryomyces fabryi]|uniref:Response regulatory domain-containing protein n=1 Tax=Debaryomyces fabryi TaxID=58627 RepID=A0A0V1Q5I9_9ASCO|nr:uncharacterized protein AC631_00533 [Debaryomyces fabryi]KSA03721.1 hypothetical protein AC631_00533 [Debaryomyces fabryi]CUM53360.1 unnamed protein product [Debaryomyces fabryi]
MSNLHILLPLPSKHSYFIPGFGVKNSIQPPSNPNTSNPIGTNSNSQSNSQTNNNSNNQSNMPKTSQKQSNFPINFSHPSSTSQNTLGQFSPSIFTTRRVWVKKSQGTPTTIVIHQNDIIDDLKQAVVNKFPNSLAREIDPADLIIKMDLLARQTVNVASNNQNLSANKKTTYPSNTGLLTSPDNFKSVKSPIASQSSGTQTQQQTNPYSYVNLEPDQNVWNILDSYYPNGMGMQEAFIIEAPYVEPASNRSSFNAGFPNNYNQRGLYPQVSQQLIRSTNPSQISNTSQSYHQPKPQYMHQSNPIAQNQGTIHYKSVSPASITNGRQSPLSYGSNVHRRSQSNPLQSPSFSSTNVTNHNNNENSQAVLLLPKNFSLASNTNSLSTNPFHNKKRLSLDESFVQKNRQEPINESPVDSSTNLTNIGMGIHSQSHSVPEPYELNSDSNGGRKLEERSNTDPENHHQKSDISKGDDRLSISPSPSIDESSSNKQNISLDQILSGEDSNNLRPIKKNVGTPESFKHSNYIGKAKEPNSMMPKGTKLSKLTTDTVLPSISVLVVEDNAINQAILGAFLRKYKIPYQIAKNGQEAVDKWRTGGFHLVLMDIQLPVKSGIEATKEIRHLEKINKIGVFAQHELTASTYSNSEELELKENEKLDLTVFRSPVIIVALTASSNSSVDRKNALRAGCNDYLTKPVNLVWLQNKITEWGCMQTLIDFDGWKAKRSVNSYSSDRALGSSK